MDRPKIIRRRGNIKHFDEDPDKLIIKSRNSVRNALKALAELRKTTKYAWYLSDLKKIEAFKEYCLKSGKALE